MLTIQKITKAKNNFYLIELSNHETLQLSEDLLVRYRLLKGREIEETELEDIKKKAGYDMGLQLAMNYLSYQIHSEKEIYSYLKEKDIDYKDQKMIVQRLKELKLIDDQIYAESYIRTQVRLSDKGPQYLAQQLKLKGLSQENIDHGLEFYTEKQQLEVAIKTGTKFLKKLRHKSQRESSQKLQQQLMQKGFSKDIIQEAVLLLEETPDEEAEYEALVYQADKLWQRDRSKDAKKRAFKIKQKLFQKGFDLAAIQRYLDEKEDNNDNDE